jgi:YebC/PmpR family DNA-binding regulatory protein
MSGHSKWASIKHKKGKEDAKRGKLFTKIIREIIVAARIGGGDPNSNARLRTALDKAKAANMPKDNITNAIKKGTGELEGVKYEEALYEGYGPGGVAVLVEVMTDSKNRTSAEIRKIFSRGGGDLGAAGCVAWMFSKKGLIVIEKAAASEDQVMDVALEAGADDVKDAESVWEVTTSQDSFHAVKEAFDKKGIKYTLSEISMIPQTTIKLTGKHAEQMVHLVEELEEHDDVQNVFSNFDISEEELQRISAAG